MSWAIFKQACAGAGLIWHLSSLTEREVWRQVELIARSTHRQFRLPIQGYGVLGGGAPDEAPRQNLGRGP